MKKRHFFDAEKYHDRLLMLKALKGLIYEYRCGETGMARVYLERRIKRKIIEVFKWEVIEGKRRKRFNKNVRLISKLFQLK